MRIGWGDEAADIAGERQLVGTIGDDSHLVGCRVQRGNPFSRVNSMERSKRDQCHQAEAD